MLSHPYIWYALLVFVVLVLNLGWYALLTLFLLIGAGGVGFAFGYVVGEADGKTAKKQTGPTIDEMLRRAEEKLRQAEEAQRQRRAARPRPRKPPIPAHWKLLGLKPGASMAQINTRYHELALKAHPDRPGGSVRAMQALNIARDLARREALAKV